MKALSQTAFSSLLQGSQILELDGLGPKVYRLADNTILKVFRRRPWLSGGSLWPYAKRFARNAEVLRKRGFTTPEIITVYRLDDSINATALHYHALPGATLRHALEHATFRQQEQWVEALGRQLSALHQKGVYFRSAHLGNFLLMPEGHLGMIDLADIRLSSCPLSKAKRIRNLRHISRYPNDKHWLFKEHVEAFLRGYAHQSPAKYVHALTKAIGELKA